MIAIQTKNLTKKLEEMIAVDSLNLSIEQGELFTLLGVNGAGKTTTIKMLTYLSIPTTGDATILGNSIVSNPYAVKEQINVSPQETAVAPNLSVKENLELYCATYTYSDCSIIISFIAALFLGLPFNANVLLSILVLLPTSLLFIGKGLLVGSIFNDKQVGGICGALLTNMSAWLSASRAALSGENASILLHFWWMIGYTGVIVTISIFVFKKKMNGENA
ncbi:ATP-binding cassette domain-containing protein [Bacillus sp. 28A-2]|uniref:ATP-binding cassette domain-containing protein n=1 Tax=Bacillus sp. 28A-2 TaxID=2772252 RepID=UPI001CD05045|nr:ATP-binding cassette domain-containing protein [Bacillus sp. 28A-2]